MLWLRTAPTPEADIDDSAKSLWETTQDAVPRVAGALTIVLVGWLLASLLGGLLGAERELDGQEAGLRTHLLLALGAALFGAMPVGAFDGFIADSSDTNVRVDVSRIASYVDAGIGFIGGGTILKHRAGRSPASPRPHRCGRPPPTGCCRRGSRIDRGP